LFVFQSQANKAKATAKANLISNAERNGTEQITQQKAARSGSEKEFSFILARQKKNQATPDSRAPQKAYAVHVCGINQS